MSVTTSYTFFLPTNNTSPCQLTYLFTGDNTGLGKTDIMSKEPVSMKIFENNFSIIS